MRFRALVVTSMMLLAGCSSGDDQGNQAGGDHVWKEQVDTMDKARATEQAVMDAAAKHAEAVEQQTE